MTAPNRDYCGEMRKVIDEASSHGPYVPRQLATEIVEKLMVNDRELLMGWLRAQAEHFVWQAINDRDRSARSHARTAMPRRRFHEAAAGPAAERSVKIRDFLGMRFSVADGTRRELRDLKAEDLTFVGDDYERRENENAFWKVFMRALAKSVGEGSVGDHYSNEQLNKMFGSSELRPVA